MTIAEENAQFASHIRFLEQENERLVGELADIKAGLIAKHVPDRVLAAIADGTREEGGLAERETVLSFLAQVRIECVADGDTRYGSFVEGLEDAIRKGEHHATLQEGPGSSRSPEASADSMVKPSSMKSDGASG